ncbi:PD-(D/E)XK nuclease family protein [Zunongwangia sp. F363]|uniref:PD-(D/E)XK nuclease family protein n=1 Tax=Autumnicola tepida TaxID=3075595 RepID=A0ABU3CBA0_9FLAO|nr:PD-(D/E)XK nuclease family protein [Zunongwangia sp. F363]MDT0643607.1 PD-(D/E)XK nuclease family protein [Zunongwangia sp. F363]
MRSFIKEVLEKTLASEEDISEVIFILPSKRAGSFLLNELSGISSKSIFAPQIFSIEEFTEKISGLKSVDNTISIFEFFEVYRNCTPTEKQEDFETFMNWAQTLIHDFNEIDRYLINHKEFFNYLSEIQDLNHWYLQKEKTDLIKNYLRFWHTLPEYYEKLKEQLLSKNQAYQGLIYREAATKIRDYLQHNKQKHIFIGFNALNAAEEQIFQAMLEKSAAEVFWDIDEVFLQDREHGASLFIREYLQKWPYYKSRSKAIPVNEYASAKKIEITGVPKNIGQAKHLGEILANMNQDELQKTAVVLGEEDLLLPVLNSLPPNIDALNITMGFPLKNAPLASFFEKLFQLHLHNEQEYYYKEVLAVLNHPAIAGIQGNVVMEISSKINRQNLVYLKPEKFLSLSSQKESPILKACFNHWKDSPEKALQNLQEIVQQIKNQLKAAKDKLGLEFLYQFHVLFNKLESLLKDYPHIKNLKSLYHFYKEIMSTQSLDFQGRPFQGLQLMGMLESRALDFENVIITSLNEGVLPAGKSSNSFIPYDLKKAYRLPTYREKDAVYTYHFYRLLQRAKNIHLLYNTESSGLGAGEKSRFLTQLEIEKQPAHKLKKNLVAPRVNVATPGLKEIKKTPAVMEQLKNLANSGFSPSALTTYIRNPLDFYHQYVLGIREQEEVEETVAYNTLGTVVHDTLQNFYEPLEDHFLSEEIIKRLMEKVDSEIQLQFHKSYTQAPMDKGKNLLIFEVAKRYVLNFLKFELERIKNGEEIKILQIERNLKTAIEVQHLDFPVFIRGKVDRVENTNGITRIIDYKTGKVEQNKIEIVDWESITTDYDRYSKSFQVLSYATMLNARQNFIQPVEAGIISFKNMKGGFLKFCKKDKPGQRSGKKSQIDTEVLAAFGLELQKLIAEICNPEIPFIEKEIKPTFGSY